MSDQVAPGGAGTGLLAAFAVTWQPARRKTFGIVRVSQGSEAGRFG